MKTAEELMEILEARSALACSASQDLDHFPGLVEELAREKREAANNRVGPMRRRLIGPSIGMPAEPNGPYIADDEVPAREVHDEAAASSADRPPRHDEKKQPISKANGADTPPRDPIVVKRADAFCHEYVPLSYTIEPVLRSNALYTLTARTGHGKTGFVIAAALAVAPDRPDILGLEVAQGRVVYVACENADDVRMRLMTSAFVHNVDLGELGHMLMVVDVRRKPEEIRAALDETAHLGDFALINIDTFAAFFDGDNVNDAVQGGAFMRRMRPLTQLRGLPAVIVAAHPVKNASEEQLIPYGSGAILNEVDGNLTLWKRPETGIVNLHWQGKLRGLEFQPVPFRFDISASPDVIDAKGRQVQLPTIIRSTAEADDDRKAAEINIDVRLMRTIIEDPKGSQRDWAAKIERAPSNINGRLQRLADEKLVEQVLGKWTVTPKGQKALDGVG
jgi:hypothetical protein